jgi:hypothetical protein
MTGGIPAGDSTTMRGMPGFGFADVAEAMGVEDAYCTKGSKPKRPALRNF